MLEIARAVQETPREPGARLPLDLLLDGLVRLTTEGRVAAIPILRRAARELPGLPDADVMRWGWAAPVAHSVLWDDSGLQRVSARNLQIARAAGAFAQLPQYIHSFGVGRLWVGDLEAVEAVMHETEGIEAATGRHGRYLMPALLAFQGREEQASALINRVIAQAASPGRADEATPALWAAAVLYNGLARYEEARSAAQKATRNRFNVSFAVWALPELVEAAARTGDAELARDALERLAETTQPSGSDFALGIEARSRALISDSDRAELLYREAIERLETRQLRPDLARAHLLHGEWLRRQGRRADARTQLRAAHEIFTGIGMEAFAQRARRELLATGEKVGKRSPQKRIALTPQEEQIARLARAGLSNPEIGAQLFISARTVEWHLRNVFAKLGISTRRELRTALPEGLGYAGRI
jgi:DNA-binding CsgD family transcriptional regulator